MSQRRALVAFLNWFFVRAALAAAPVGLSAGGAHLPAVDVSREMQALVEADWIARDRLFGVPAAKTPSVSANAVTTVEDAAGGCDGIKTGAWGFHTQSAEKDAWWQVDLGRVYQLDRVLVFNRCDRPSRSGFKFQVQVAEEAKPKQFRTVYQHNGAPFSGVKDNKPLAVNLKDQDVSARIVRLFVPGRFSFALDEVEVYAVDNPKQNIALKRPADQKSVGKWSTRPSEKKQTQSVAAFVAPASPAFSLAHTQATLERATKLAARLAPTADRQRLAALSAEVEKVRRQLADLKTRKEAPEAERRALYFAACQTARQIAFCNPLLTGVDRLLFLKRHDSQGVIHMCDQFYGCNAKPGGGLFVLENPCGPRPKLLDLLSQSVVEKGRLAGKPLRGGSLLSPDVSFDGRTIAFAYTQAEAYAKTQGKAAYLWAPEYSFHLFRVNRDGSGLEQLTDGDADDFDPCFLPNGRVAFISERRGGYLRCGRHCPVYTLFSMQPDGSDITCLSFHETHEWQPSVDNHGMLVYTRWDYVDRDTNIAHHIWTSYPDGRDPRSFHGNYPERRESRPWMEMDIRAIPGSHKYVATAGAHHGHAIGSLVLIDPRVPDDGSMSQVTRLTPEAPFPEAEKGPMAYATPWPLSEDDYLCVYDPAAKNHGVYWIDRDGNKELLYRDPAIACFSPMPLRARPMPPALPERTASADAVASSDRATIAVMNVYNADFAWPADTRITALRVIQVLPKSTAPPNVPRIGVANQTNARAVLGTVPVESDGSAYFEAPPGKAIYFQALDERGLAVQSMRSATYAHPGERLVCQGCHERKQQPPAGRAAAPLALRRAPSPIAPDVEGSKPFNYVRLVQPVLDRRCVQCHAEKKALDLSGAPAPKTAWTQSYANLAGKYGFYFHVGNGSIKDPLHGGARTTPGKFGARAAKLMEYLGPQHYDVRLTPEEFHRIALWLDCNSEFLGAYEKPQEQARGELVAPSLE